MPLSAIDPAAEDDDPIEDEDLDEDADVELEPPVRRQPDPPPAPRRVSSSFAPGLRQPGRPKTEKPTGELPWWAKAPREGLTAEGEKRAEEMSKTKQAKSINGAPHSYD